MGFRPPAAPNINLGTLVTSVPLLTQAGKLIPDDLQREGARIMDTKLGRKITKLLPDQIESALGTLVGGVYDSGTTVDEMERRADPQQNIHWEIILPDAVSNLPNFYVDDVILHTKQTEVKEYQRANSFRHDPGTVRYDGVSLILYEDIRGKATRFFQNWAKLIEHNALYGRPREYKQTMIVRLYDPKKIVSVQATVRRCWPISADGHQLTSESSDRIRLQVQFVNDIIKWEIFGTGASGSADFLNGIGINLGDVFGTSDPTVNRFLNAALNSGVSKLFKI